MRQLNYYHRSNDFKTTIFVTLALGAIYEGYKLLDHVGKKIIDKKMNPGNSKPDRVEEHRQMKQIDFEYMQKSEEYKRSLVESEVNKGKITTKINKLNDMIRRPHLQGEESMLVPGLIKLGDMCIIFSLPGTGKSALITQMAFGIDRGHHNLLSYTTQNRKKRIIRIAMVTAKMITLILRLSTTANLIIQMTSSRT